MNRIVILLLVLAALFGCKEKRLKAVTVTAPPAAAQTGPPRPARAQEVRTLLQRVPAGHQAVLLQDLEQVYRLWDSLEAALRHTADGKRLVQRARIFGAAAPVSVPFARKDLAGLGLDPAGVVLAHGWPQPEVFVFPLAHAARFRWQVAALLQVKQPRWKVEQLPGGELRSLSGEGQLFCNFSEHHATCSPSRAALVATMAARPPRSVWHQLAAPARAALARAAIFVSVNAGGVQLDATLRAEADGITINAWAAGKPVTQLLSMLAGQGKGSALGLARGARSMLCARFKLDQVLALLPGLLTGLRPADRARLEAGFTGEVLLLEPRVGGTALLLTSRSPALTGKLAQTLAAVLAANGKLLTRRGALTSLSVSPLKQRGARAFQVALSAPGGKGDRRWDLRLAAGKAGVLLGTPEAVKALSGAQAGAGSWSSLPPAAASMVLDPQMVLASHSLLREPFAAAPGVAQVERFIGVGQVTPEVQQALAMVRFLYEQLHSQTMALTRLGPARAALVLRLVTLHRPGQAADEARALYISGLKAKDEQDTAAYHKVLQILEQRFSATRYGALRRREPGGAVGPIMLAGAAAAAAIISYQQHRRRMQAPPGRGPAAAPRGR